MIGDGSEGFGHKRLKYVVSLRRSRANDSGDDQPFLGLEHVQSWTGRLSTGNVGPYAEQYPGSGESLSGSFETGDVLFGKLRPYLAKAWMAEFSGRCTTEFLVLTPMAIEGRFLRYVFLWNSFIDVVDASTFGSKMPRADWDFIGNVPVPLPDCKVQQAIADYLDRETARIDALIAAKERLLALVAEKRQALITRAVTRGLDPNVPLRDSGIPWLGKIPAHWNIQKFTRSVVVAEGQVDPEGEPYSSMPLIAPDHIESGTGRVLRLETASEQGAISGKYLCQTGQVIYSKIRPALRKVTLAPCACLCSADMYPLRTKGELMPDYLMMYLLADPFSIWAILESARVAMPKINRDALIEVRMPVPPHQEQIDIVKYIVRETSKLDAVRDATNRTIALLKERRAALIAAAVTGQIQIPSEAVA